MNIETLIDQGKAIVYDRDVVTDPEARMFEPAHWQSANALVGSAPGRAKAFFLEAPFGATVLRLYRRGGWAARVSDDRYLFTGFENSRPFREFRLLAEMIGIGLPVPAPIAAFCEKSGMRYRGALITRTIPNAVTLADALKSRVLQSTWADVGRCIRRFHDAGVHHADLNARNVLLQEGGKQVFLIDFDRGSLSQGRAVDGRGNLARLRRSLEKLWPREATHPLATCWSWLEEAYHG